jgi:hypothetical protein
MTAPTRTGEIRPSPSVIGTRACTDQRLAHRPSAASTPHQQVHSKRDCSGAARSRCARIFAMTAGSSMLAMTLNFPPQRAQASMSIPKAGPVRGRTGLTLTGADD